MFGPIGINAGEHFVAFLGIGSTGTHGIEVESDFFEFGEPLRREAIVAQLAVEFALSTDPIRKLSLKWLMRRTCEVED
jgi:hypothetical protein